MKAFPPSKREAIKARARSRELSNLQQSEANGSERNGVPGRRLVGTATVATGFDGHPTGQTKLESYAFLCSHYVSRGVPASRFDFVSMKEIQAATTRPTTVASRGVL
jgi:hypothetical protein